MKSRPAFFAVALLAGAFTAPGASAQASTDLADYLDRYGQLAEHVWQFQIAGKDLCQSSQVWLPGIFFSPVGNAETIDYNSVQEQPLSVERVFTGGPAAAAGLQRGDEVLEINGDDVVGRNWRNESRWDPIWEETITQPDPVQVTIRRGSTTSTVTIAPVAACDVRLIYTRQRIPAPKTQGLVLINGMIDEVTTQPWQEMAFLAPEVALTMNAAQTRENTAKRWADKLANVVQATTGLDIGIAQFAVNLKMTKKSRLEGDRIGLYLLARVGVDVSQVPTFWKSVYNYPSDGHWSSTFFGIGPTLAEREAVFAETLADIAGQQAAGLPLDPRP